MYSCVFIAVFVHFMCCVIGWSRSQYSNFHIDQYGSAPYVGILDGDSMIKGYCGEKISFFNETGSFISTIR